MNTNKKIMVVDDDPDILISLRGIFEKQGYEVLTVDSGMDCIYEIERGYEGIILMDIMMPFMDGWDTINEIKNRGLDTRVIISILTAKGTKDHEKLKGLESIVYDYITKPFEINDIIENVKKMRAM